MASPLPYPSVPGPQLYNYYVDCVYGLEQVIRAHCVSSIKKNGANIDLLLVLVRINRDSVHEHQAEFLTPMQTQATLVHLSSPSPFFIPGTSSLHLSLQLWFWLLLSFLFLPDVESTSSGYNHPSPLLWTTSLCSQPILTPTLPQKVNLHHNPFLNQLNLSSVGVHANNLGIMRKHAVADLAGLGQVLRFCISNMFPGNTSDSGAWTHQTARDQTRTPFQVATAQAGQESLALF